MTAQKRSQARQWVWNTLNKIRDGDGRYLIRMDTLRRRPNPLGRLMPLLDQQVSMLMDRVGDIRTVDRYVEPGYSLDDDKAMILFGDWNGFSQWNQELRQFIAVEPVNTVFLELVKRLGDVCELEWGDEWANCHECGGAFRTEPDSYGWLRSFIDHDGDHICHECIEKDPERYLDWWVGDHRKAITNRMINPEDFGFVRLKDQCEHGFHRGQDASPEKMADVMRSRGVKRFLFTIDGAGQFDITFSLWVHKEELEQAGNLGDDDINGPSLAAAMERTLRSASLCSPDPEPGKDGVIYSKVDLSTGNITTRKISPQEFAEKGIS